MLARVALILGIYSHFILEMVFWVKNLRIKVIGVCLCLKEEFENKVLCT